MCLGHRMFCFLSVLKHTAQFRENLFPKKPECLWSPACPGVFETETNSSEASAVEQLQSSFFLESILSFLHFIEIATSCYGNRTAWLRQSWSTDDNGPTLKFEHSPAFLNVLALSLLLMSWQNHGKKLDNRHSCLSCGNWRRFWLKLRPLKGAKLAISFGSHMVEAKLVNNKEVSVGTVEPLWSLLWSRVSGNTTNLAADMAKWNEGMEIDPPTKSCIAKQASLGNVGIRVVRARSCR